MSGEYIIKKIEDHLISKKISVTITSPWTDYAKIMLDTINVIIKLNPKIRRIIIIGSKQVIKNRWKLYLKNKAEYKGITYVAALGRESVKRQAYKSNNMIVLTNDESLGWMNYMKISGTDMVILDDLSRYRHSKTDRYRSTEQLCRKAGRIAAFLRQPFAPNGIDEIWEEIHLLENSKRLGLSKADFLDRYFYVSRIFIDGHIKVYKEPKENAVRAIVKALEDICMDVSGTNWESRDNINERDVYVELSRGELSRYRLMAKEFTISFSQNSDICKAECSTVASKLIQMSGGTVYDDKKETVMFHEKKIKALKQLIQEFHGNNILVAYWFKHELKHITDNINGARKIIDKDDIDDWNNGRIPVGVINPGAKAEYGDLSGGGNILIWFSLTWSLDLYKKTNDRISDCLKDSTIIRLITLGTLDETVVRILNEKKEADALMLDEIKRCFG